MRTSAGMDLVIVGSVALDTVETPFGKVSLALGGTATYGSIAASYFARPGVVGVVVLVFALDQIGCSFTLSGEEGALAFLL